ncbi:hypothetical protein [Kingella denitrificans]|uniref:hypothetical protein n=1 Tax=Kingella denitrificans TaxID=502 RepID=UPI0011D15EBF|nr:hypothetical protein [Kingella denitrificans]
MADYIGYSCILIILDIPVFYFAAYLYHTSIESEREEKRLEQLSPITLPAPQTVAGIAMPAGTYLETEIAKRKQSEPEKFIYARFPQPVVWNGIPIVRMKRDLSIGDEYWQDRIIYTEPEKPVSIGQWICQTGLYLEWQLLPQADGKPPEIPSHQSAEHYVYLSDCTLEDGQTALLPEFGAVLEVGAIRRENDKYRDAAKGFWRTGASGYGEESRKSGRMDFYSLELSVDTARVVHEFSAELGDNPSMNCQMPEHTFLVWQKSRPNVVLAASPEPKRIPKKCWGKTLVPTPIEALSKQLGPNYASFFDGAEQYFKQAQAASSEQKNFEKP